MSNGEFWFNAEMETTVLSNLHPVRLRFYIVKHVTDSEQILLGDRLDPFVFFHFQNRLIADQVKVSYNGNEKMFVWNSIRWNWIQSEKLPISGGSTVKRLFWMCSSLKRTSSPISRGISRRSLSRSPSWKKFIFFFGWFDCKMWPLTYDL